MKLGTVGGIGVYIHWSFWLLIAVYLVSATLSSSLTAGLLAAAFVMSVFACVLLHEFGHAAAAAAFGIKTADITLLPIGGVARLTRLPDRPYQELIIAVAGPAVNVVIAAVLLAVIAFGIVVGGSTPMMGEMDMLKQLLAANIVLVVFNMLPAFPMDGGRVLRSLLAMFTTHLRATEIAARVGRWMALALGLYGLFYSFPLVLIAVFIFFAGTAELMAARVRAAQASGLGGFGGFNVQQGPSGTATFTWQRSWPPVYEDVVRSPQQTQPNSAQSRVPNGRSEIVDAVSVKHL